MIPADLLASIRERHGHNRLYELDGPRYVTVGDAISEIERLQRVVVDVAPYLWMHGIDETAACACGKAIYQPAAVDCEAEELRVRVEEEAALIRAMTTTVNTEGPARQR